jgi:hypothetical protein
MTQITAILKLRGGDPTRSLFNLRLSRAIDELDEYCLTVREIEVRPGEIDATIEVEPATPVYDEIEAEEWLVEQMDHSDWEITIVRKLCEFDTFEPREMVWENGTVRGMRDEDFGYGDPS